MRKLKLFIALIMLAVLAASCTAVTVEPKLRMHVIDVGQGDSILLQAKGKNVLVDAGERSQGSTVVDYLKRHHVRQLDLLITTHPHSDHIGGVVEVLKNLNVKRIIDSGKVHTSQTYLDYLRLVEKMGIPFEVASFQKVSLSPEAELEIIGPVKDYANLNDSSVVAKVTIGSVSILLTGDMERAAEKDLLALTNLKASILKVGHHGSRTSTTEEFLHAVSPRIAIISVGALNSYGHPAEEVLSRLHKSGALVYRTDQHGTVVITTDGRAYSVITEKGAK